MMPNKKQSSSEDLHKTALQQFKRGLDADKHNRAASLEDAQFCSGEQWPDAVQRQRVADGRPCLVVNRMPMFVRQVANEVRMKPPNIQVIPTEEGDKQTAEVIEGLIRAIEARSKAKRIYSRGIEDAARCNMGWWRVLTRYVDEKTFDQEIILKTIDNPLSVVFDPDAADPMLSDAKFMFVIDTMSKDAFKAKYGENSIYGLEGDVTTEVNEVGWQTTDSVQVAEYWYVEEKEVELVQRQDGTSVPKAEFEQAYKEYKKLYQEYEQALSEGVEIDVIPEFQMPVTDEKGVIKTRKSIQKKVCSRIMSGGSFLSEPFEFAGERIPIIPVWGEEFRVGERKVRHSVISNAKDAQRQINYWRSAAVESMALAPKAPWLVTPRNIEDFENQWRMAGSGNPSVLVYNPDPQTGKPERIMPAPVQAAMLQEAQMSQDDLKATTGIFDAAVGAQSNETSGKAIMARQREGDVSTYVFVDNLMSAVEETGRIIIGLIPKIYDNARQIRILGKKMETKVIQVNQIGGIDLTKEGFDVHIATGSSVTTQRQENAETFTELLRTAPNLAPILIPRLIAMMDMPDADEIAEEIKGIGRPQEQPPNPKDIATAEKMKAETMGISLDNQAKFQSLNQMPQGLGYPSY